MTTFFDGPKPRLFAHRGASGEAPENTMAAFQRAVDMGIEYIELDVHASEDGQVMVIHDATIERTTNGLGAVRNYSLAALQQLDAGYRFSPDEGKMLPFRASDVIIPSLQEVLRSFPQVKFTVEIKPSDPPIEEPVIAVVKDCDRADDVIIASEHDVVLARVRTLAPDMPTNFGYNEVVDFIQRVATGQLDGYQPSGRALQIPPTYQNIPLVTEQTVAAAHQLNVEIHAWTINEPHEMRSLLDLGVDGVMSDFPSRLLEVARGRG